MSAGASKELREVIRTRCEQAGLEYEEYEDMLFPDDILVEVAFPCGRSERTITISEENLQSFADVEFEKYRFIDGYTAVYIEEDEYIEADVIRLGASSNYAIENVIFGQILPRENRKLLLNSERTGAPEIEFGASSDTFKRITQRFTKRQYSLKIRGCRIPSYDDAKVLLEQLTDSIFFQVDMLTGMSLGLRREQGPPRVIGGRRREPGMLDVEYPDRGYDKAPMSFYWYGKTASGMPLLQFLAFYQVLEFYFPIYSKAEAKRRIALILKNPTFRKDRDSDLGSILNAIQTSRGGGFGDERGQLRATLIECIDTQRLRAFVEETTERKASLSKKIPDITDHKLPIADSGADLRDSAGNRIYDIRCKIVHTKSDHGGVEVRPLLPFSPDAEKIHEDIELIEFMAQQVLITASTQLELGA